MIEKASEKKENADNHSDYSSGIESDNDLDLLVEQEVLEAVRMRKALRNKLGKEEDSESEGSKSDDEAAKVTM